MIVRQWMSIHHIAPAGPSRTAALCALIDNLLVVMGLRAPLLGGRFEAVAAYVMRTRARLRRLFLALEDGSWRARRRRVRRDETEVGAGASAVGVACVLGDVGAAGRVGAARVESGRRARVRFSGRFGWLKGDVGAEMLLYAAHLERFLGEAETQALIARASDQAGRLLRPLARMLGISVPGLPARAVADPAVVAAARAARRRARAEDREALRYRNVEGRPIDLWRESRRIERAARRVGVG